MILGFGGWGFKIERPTCSATNENLVAHGFPMTRVLGKEITFGDQKDAREGLRDQVAIYNTSWKNKLWEVTLTLRDQKYSRPRATVSTPQTMGIASGTHIPGRRTMACTVLSLIIYCLMT